MGLKHTVTLWYSDRFIKFDAKFLKMLSNDKVRVSKRRPAWANYATHDKLSLEIAMTSHRDEMVAGRVPQKHDLSIW